MEVNEADAKYLVPSRRRPTELGALPADWDVIGLATRATIQSGIAKNANAVLRDPVAVPYLRVANVQDGYLDLREVAWIEIERADLNRYAVLPGDVLMNEGGDLDKLGRGALWHGQINPCVHQNHVFVVRCKAGLVPEYLNAWTSTAQARRYFMLAGRQTTNLASINKTSLGELTVAVPPTEGEQHEIANAISDAEVLIDSLEQLLTKKRQIKQGAMQELLTGKRRLPGYAQPWITRRLGSIAPLQRGFDLPSRARRSGEYPVVYSNGILNFHCEFMVKGPGVVTGRSGTIGAVTFVEQDYWPHNTSLWVTNFKGSDPKFVFYLFQHVGLERFATGSGVPTLNRNDVHAFEVHVPASVSEQAEIAQALSEIDTELTTLESRLTKARALKQAMAQALLTGRIRIPLDPLEPAVPVPPPKGVGALGSGPARTQEPTA